MMTKGSLLPTKNFPGVTLVEVLLTLFIFLTILYFGIMGLSKTFQSAALRQGAQQVVDDIKEYQQKAMTEQKAAVFTFTAGQGQYVITYNSVSKTRNLPKNVTVNSFSGLTGISANELRVNTDGGVQNDSTIIIANSQTTLNVIVKTSGFIRSVYR